jgi:hypothetical protein
MITIIKCNTLSTDIVFRIFRDVCKVQVCGVDHRICICIRYNFLVLPRSGHFAASAEAEAAELKNGRSFGEAYFMSTVLLARAWTADPLLFLSKI